MDVVQVRGCVIIHEVLLDGVNVGMQAFIVEVFFDNSLGELAGRLNLCNLPGAQTDHTLPRRGFHDLFREVMLNISQRRKVRQSLKYAYRKLHLQRTQGKAGPVGCSAAFRSG